jgi:protein involved in polysaccharide export with SLBB domain
LNDLKSAGLSPQDLAAKLTQLFAARLVNPEVNVIATKVRDPMVYVAGDSTAVVAVPYREAPTAMQAIALAGGLKRSAASRSISIVRLTEDGYLRAIPVKVGVGGQPGSYMALRTSLLQADDIVFVPENGRSQVSRFLDDIIDKPLVGVTSALGLYVNYKLIDVLR